MKNLEGFKNLLGLMALDNILKADFTVDAGYRGSFT
jgi:hypothetical protein